MGSRCGHVAIVGKPNAGKSTLFNALIEQKISSITYKRQTTRHRILGVRTDPDAQYVFVDTPGIHQGGSRLINKVLNKNAYNSLFDVDLILWVVDCKPWTREDELVLKWVKEADRPTILVVNKVDVLPSVEHVLPLLQTWSERYPFAGVVPVSALKSDNLSELLKASRALLPESDPLFPEEYVTDRSLNFLVGEAIRESIFVHLAKELPYATHVEVEKFEEQKQITRIHAAIWVEKPGQKGILIGNKGAMLKQIGSKARERLQTLLETKVHLELWVKVQKDWQDDPKFVGRYEQ